MSIRCLSILSVLILLTACGKRSGFEIEKLTIITQNPRELASWYEENLGFEASENSTELTLNELTIFLEENVRAQHRDSLKDEHEVNHVPGFFKVGFLTNQFDELIKSLRDKNVTFVGGIVTDSIVQKRMQIIKDSDGNRIQLFESTGRHKLKPYFVSLIVEFIGEQEKWYQLKFQITDVHNLDIPEQNTHIRLLEGEDFLFELIKTSDKNILDAVDYDYVTGFHEIVIHGARGSFEGDHEGHAIVSP